MPRKSRIDRQWEFLREMYAEIRALTPEELKEFGKALEDLDEAFRHLKSEHAAEAAEAVEWERFNANQRRAGDGI